MAGQFITNHNSSMRSVLLNFYDYMIFFIIVIYYNTKQKKLMNSLMNVFV